MKEELEYQMTDLTVVGRSGKSYLLTDKTEKLGLLIKQISGEYFIAPLQRFYKFGVYEPVGKDTPTQKALKSIATRGQGMEVMIKMLQEVAEFINNKNEDLRL